VPLERVNPRDHLASHDLVSRRCFTHPSMNHT
jgi:hypothetical protein